MASASIGDPQSLNLFAYVTNNPVDFVDPSGLDDETEEDSIIIITREPDWLKAVKSGGGASGGNGGSERGKDNGRTKGSGGGGLPQNRTPCENMARRAEKIAKKWLAWFEKEAMKASRARNRSAFPGLFRALREGFDREFVTPYMGTSMGMGGVRGRVNAMRLWWNNGNVGRTMPMSELGQDDFKTEFLDQKVLDSVGGDVEKARAVRPTNSDMNSDQVHHFAAYLSLGLGGLEFVKKKHEETDLDNPDDLLLGDTVFRAGKEIRENPRKLYDIGSWIRREICE